MLRSFRALIIAAGLLTISLYYYLSFDHVNVVSNNRFRPLSIVKSGFDWSSLQPHYPVASIIPLPSGPPLPRPRIQHEFSKLSRFTTPVQEYRRRAVKKAFQKCWKSYREQAWMRDELKPVHGGGKDTFGGFAATLIDALDTLWIMGLRKEFNEAVDAVVTIDWANTTSTALNMFETTIRHLGGLISAYDLDPHPALLEKAVELGDMLYMGFDTPNHMPPFWLDFNKAKSGGLVADEQQPLAAFGSLSLEFSRLSQLTGNDKYYDAVARVTSLLEKHQQATKLPGMWPTYINLRSENFAYDNAFTIGALADSAYEYLPKTHALLGGLNPVYEKMYRASAETIQKNLLFRPMTPNNSDILFSGTRYMGDLGRLEAEAEHLTCFAGGMFALAGRIFNIDAHVEIGTKLARGCAWAYNAFPNGIMPEVFLMATCKSLDGCEWDERAWKNKGGRALPKGFLQVRDRRYILRPEAIESVFILYRITGREEFQEAAWQMFQSIQKMTETSYGNSAIDDVLKEHPIKMDSMESFWLAETLKYFYLIFSPPDLISLDDYVFNTEAHPFRLPSG